MSGFYPCIFGNVINVCSIFVAISSGDTSVCFIDCISQADAGVGIYGLEVSRDDISTGFQCHFRTAETFVGFGRTFYHCRITSCMGIGRLGNGSISCAVVWLPTCGHTVFPSFKTTVFEEVFSRDRLVGLSITLFNQDVFQFKCTGFVRTVVDESKLDALAFVGIQVYIFRVNKIPVTAIFDFYGKFLPVFIGCFRNPYSHVVLQIVEITGTIIKSQSSSRSLRQVDSRRY